MKTSIPKQPAPVWYVVDAEGKRIGAVASKVAHVLRGKHRPDFSPHRIGGDHVVIVNIAKLDLPPEKGTRKVYYNHTGYPGHMKTKTLGKMMETSPETVLERAVKGMLPRNRLKPEMLRRLHLFAAADHPYAPQKPVSLDLSTL